MDEACCPKQRRRISIALSVITVPRRASSIRSLRCSLATCLVAGVVALSGCIACPNGASCPNCSKSSPIGIPMSIPSIPPGFPWIEGNGKAVECGSACEECEACESDASCCDAAPPESEADLGSRASLYERSVDRLVVQPATTLIMSAFSVAGTAFGTVANYCMPEVALGPPQLTPPGRFHPVPTRPVFAQRQ